MTYADLQGAICDWLNRGDLANVVPSFIALAEAEMNRTLRVRDMLVRGTDVLSDQFTALPEDFLEFSFVQVEGETEPMENLGSPDELRKARRGSFSTPGIPRKYCIHGNELEVAPVPDTSYDVEWSYYAAIPPLGDFAPENWLLTKHPDLYLYGALVHSAPYLKDDARVSLWAAGLDRVTASIRAADERSKLGGSPPRIQNEVLGGSMRTRSVRLG